MAYAAAASLIPPPRPLLPAPRPNKQDFQGQKLSEYLYYYIIILFGAAGWLYGWREGSFLPAFYAWAAGLVLSLLVSQ